MAAGCLVASLVLLVDIRRESVAARAEASEAMTALRADVRAAEESNWADAKETIHNCHADNAGVTCTVTNVAPRPITTCMQGSITQKKASGVKLSSLIMCTGRIAPRESKVMNSPWVGGFAKDVCFSTTQFNTTLLDWDVCDFTTGGVDIPALQQQAAAPPATAASANPTGSP